MRRMRTIFLALIVATILPAWGAPMTDLRLLLPPVVPALPGRECNLYFDNATLPAPATTPTLHLDARSRRCR